MLGSSDWFKLRPACFESNFSVVQWFKNLPLADLCKFGGGWGAGKRIPLGLDQTLLVKEKPPVSSSSLHLQSRLDD